MRNWDNWLRYQDNDRNPLHGCIQFMVKDGNTVAPIYDSEGTALANPQVTDIYGRTQHQVFIDTDVIAYFYKYVGEGVWSQQDGIDTSDVSKWSLQYTSENVLDILVNITSDAVVSIGTIAELREVDVDSIPTVAGKKFVTLLGYFNSGDKEPINYYWNSESTEQDDGGSVIASENNITGRWIMIQPTEHVDSRHFGAFPYNSSIMEDQTYAITKLFNYCYTKGLRPFFNGSEDYKWFKYTNLDVVVDYIDVTNFTYFNDNGTSIITGEWNGNPRFYNGNTNIVAKNVKTSWNARSYISYKNVEIDADTTNKNWSNAIVNITISPATGFNFTNCVLSEHANLTVSNTFNNCKLTSKMFNTSTTVIGNSCTNCQIDIDDFTDDINLWNLLNISQGTLPNIDFRNVTIPEDFGIYGQYNSDRTYSNFIGTSDTGHEFGDGMGNHKYTFNNVTGNIILEADGTITYEFNNCSVNLQFEHKNSILTLLFNDSTVTVNDDLINTNIVANSSTVTLNSEYASVYSRDCTINGLSNSTVISTPNFSALSSVLNVSVSSYNLVLKDSQLNKDIHSINNGTSIHAYIDNCVWNNMQQFISSNTPSTIYTGQWINNSASKDNPIVIDTANLASADSSHSYVYENNVGTFLPKNYHNTWYEYGCFSIDRNVWNAMYVSYAESFFKPHLITRSYAFPFVDGSDKVVYSFGVCIPPNWHPDCKFFSIGAKTKKINLTVKVPFSHCEDPSGTQWYNDSTGYNPTMTHTYTGTVVTEPIVGTTYQLVDFANNILVGPRYVPFSWDKPANVPYDSSVVPPVNANDWYFVIEVETID